MLTYRQLHLFSTLKIFQSNFHEHGECVRYLTGNLVSKCNLRPVISNSPRLQTFSINLDITPNPKRKTHLKLMKKTAHKTWTTSLLVINLPTNSNDRLTARRLPMDMLCTSRIALCKSIIIWMKSYVSNFCLIRNLYEAFKFQSSWVAIDLWY